MMRAARFFVCFLICQMSISEEQKKNARSGPLDPQSIIERRENGKAAKAERRRNLSF